MSWRVVQKQNGKFAIFSTVVDDFIADDCSEGEIMDEFLEEYRDRANASAHRAIGKARMLDAMTYEELAECARLKKAGLLGDP